MKGNEENKKLVSVQSNSEEYRKVLHSLKLYSMRSDLEVKEVQRINAHSNEFDKAQQNKLVLEAWLIHSTSSETFEGPNNFENVVSKGFQIKEGSIKFPVGIIFKKAQEISDEEYTFLQCKIVVGRSLCIRKNEIPPKDKNDLPMGYDSVKVLNTIEPLKENDSEEFEGYIHEYKIYSASQILPTYIVTCKLNGDLQEVTDNMCAKCGEEEAVFYCQEDRCYLCKDCDIEVHEGQDGLKNILGKHKRVPLNERPKEFKNCKDHESKIYEFFCNTCQEPLCVLCKVNGSHSNTEFSTHAIVEIIQAYKSAESDATIGEDPALKKKKTLLIGNVKRIRDKMHEVINKCKTVEERIFQHVKEVLNILDEEIKKKLSILLSDYYELIREMEEIDHVEVFFKEQRDKINPTSFLQLWVDQKKLKQQILQNISVISDIETDIRVDGRLNIITNSQINKITSDTFTIQKNLQIEAEDEQKGTYFLSSVFKRNDAREKGDPNKSSIVSKVPRTNKMGTLESAFLKKGDALFDLPAIKKVQEDIEKIIKMIDEQMKEPAYKGSVSQESFKRSLYGRFSDTYYKWKNKIETSPNRANFTKAFKDSKILSNAEGIVLYFNLPLSDDWLPKTRLIFTVKNNSSERMTIKDLLFEFEKSSNNTPNIILLMNENGDQKFGGFAFEQWKNSPQYGANTPCFLFNLTKNIRFDAKKGKPYLQDSPAPNIIKFGETDLILEVE